MDVLTGAIKIGIGQTLIAVRFGSLPEATVVFGTRPLFPN